MRTPASQDDFAEFFTDTYPGMQRLAYLMTRNSADAEDAVAIAYTKFYPRWARGDIREPVAYLRRAVANEVTSGYRRRASQERLIDKHRVEDRGELSPEDRLVDRDEMWDALDRLPVRQRTVLVLRYYEGLSEREIAQTLGVSTGTVKSTASRGLDRLRSVLDVATPASSPPSAFAHAA